MGKLRLSLACSSYDRTRALLEDRIPIDGIDLTYLNLPAEETFYRMLRRQEFDAAEMSLSSYVVSLFSDNPPFIAIPVFPSRVFRHSSIFINHNSGIREPKDIIGKLVGSPEYQMTAAVWIRGILSDDYDVPVTSARYCNGGLEQPNRGEKLPLSLPPDIHLRSIDPGKTLSQMLGVGEIDALFSPRVPSSFVNGTGTVRRLFEDYHSVEREYFLRTRIFPIMHTVVIRREVYLKYPWVASSLYRGFVLAQREVYDDLYQTATPKYMLPWIARCVEETRALMGQDFWPYGLEPNLNTLTNFLRYSFEQGLSKRQLTPQELFAPETLESAKV
jgi:4,5-dihydroxyphthalate decarboxylase